jgi:DNA adenine methylase
MSKNFFRYPGGKSKLKKTIVPFIESKSELNPLEMAYYEPFFGGGSIGLELLRLNFKEYNFNEYDTALFYLWKTIFYTDCIDLFKLIDQYVPIVDDFEKFKDDLLNCSDTEINLGFKKLVLHQISYSGLGVKAGGPIGGKNQSSKYDVSCRWNSKKIIQKIKEIKKESFNKVINFTNNSFEDIDFGENNFLYLDPPYYEKGNELYQYGFTQKQHENLYQILNTTKNYWILSYDNNSYIKEMYKSYNIEDFDAKYSITQNRENITRVKKELLISNI